MDTRPYLGEYLCVILLWNYNLSGDNLKICETVLFESWTSFRQWKSNVSWLLHMDIYLKWQCQYIISIKTNVIYAMNLRNGFIHLYQVEDRQLRNSNRQSYSNFRLSSQITNLLIIWWIISSFCNSQICSGWFKKNIHMKQHVFHTFRRNLTSVKVE